MIDARSGNGIIGIQFFSLCTTVSSCRQNYCRLRYYRIIHRWNLYWEPRPAIGMIQHDPFLYYSLVRNESDFFIIRFQMSTITQISHLPDDDSSLLRSCITCKLEYVTALTSVPCRCFSGFMVSPYPELMTTKSFSMSIHSTRTCRGTNFDS